MRFIFFIIFFLLSLQAAEVDKRFFAIDTKQVFVEEAKKHIDTNPNKDLALLESTLLSKIKQADLQEPTVPFQKITVKENTVIDIATVQHAIGLIVSAEELQDKTQKKILQISSKLDYVKTLIEQITTENKDNLLSYQLQYVLYKLILTKEKTKHELIAEYILQSTDQIQKMIPHLYTNNYKNMREILSNITSHIEKMKEQDLSVTTQLERETILEGENVKKLTAKKSEIDKKLHATYYDAFQNVLTLSLVELALNKEESFYRSLKAASMYMEYIDSNTTHHATLYYQLVKQFAKVHFGTASMALMASKESLSDSLRYVWSLLYKPLFVFNEKAVSSMDILKILTVFILGFIVASFYRRRFLRWSETWAKATPMTVKLIANLGYYFIVFVTFIIALSSIGLDLTSFSMFASALAIGIGFGLQTVVSNMVAGIIIMFERSIRVGDLIEISETVKGTVTDIRIRSTVVKTFDNIDVVVPNSSFIQNNVVNLTLDDKTRRLHIPFGVAYGTKVETVSNAILDELAQSELNYYRGNDPDKAPVVRMVAMGSSSVDYELLVWVEWQNKQKPSALLSDFLILIYNTLYKYNIEIPFPQLDLHVKELASESKSS